jgi:hypothetical protein
MTTTTTTTQTRTTTFQSSNPRELLSCGTGTTTRGVCVVCREKCASAEEFEGRQQAQQAQPYDGLNGLSGHGGLMSTGSKGLTA